MQSTTILSGKCRLFILGMAAMLLPLTLTYAQRIDARDRTAAEDDESMRELTGQMWEYKAFSTDSMAGSIGPDLVHDDENQIIEDHLNELGDQGWQLISANDDRFVFIRSKPQVDP